MSRTFNGSTDKGVISSALLTSLASTSAFQISIWVKSDTLSAHQVAFAVGSSSSTGPLIALGLDGASTDKLYGLIRDNNASGTVLSPSNTYSTDTWHLLTLRNTATNYRSGQLDSVQASAATGTSNQAAAFSVNTTSLGCLKRTTETLFFDGKIARCTIWVGNTSAELPTLDDQFLLYAGADPTLILNANIAYHWDNDLAEDIGGQAWTFTGTATDTDNPPANSEPVTATTVADWEVPAGGGESAGFTNTGLGWDGTNILIGDFDNGRIVKATTAGAYVSDIVLAGAPASSVQGVAYDSSDGTYWVCHYAATNGTIRHYNSSGTLLDTFSPGVGNAGPSGCAYDEVNDRILAVWENGTVRGYDCADASLDETVTVNLLAGQSADGMAIDPNDADVLWVSIDTATDADFIKKYSRSTGALQWVYSCAKDPEGLVFINDTLWMGADQLFHSSVANGNRVRRLDIKVYTHPTLSLATATEITATGFKPRVTYTFA